MMPGCTRRGFLSWAGGAAATGLAGCISRPPRLDELRLSPEAEALLARAWEGLDPAQVVDVHAHLVGLGTGGTGCYVHQESHSLLSPIRLIKTRIYKNAAGVWDDERADELFLERLLDLARHQRPGARAVLLPFDQYHDEAGRPVPEMTEFHTPNDYVLDVCRRWPEHFVPACSVHPWRADALDELTRCREAGAVAVKWLPNAMGIDPGSARCDAYYDHMARLGLTLLTHTGEEQAVEAEELQVLGNPLRLRRALDHEVKVIAAHCASLGQGEDLDAAPDGSGARPHVGNFELFLRLLGEERWRELLWGDISATTQFNRCEGVLAELLRRGDLHPRLANGSDYPLPAIDPLIRTGQLVDLELLDPEERPLINELFDWNPLAFDFVLKRRLRLVEGEKVHRFADAAFHTAHLYAFKQG